MECLLKTSLVKSTWLGGGRQDKIKGYVLYFTLILNTVNSNNNLHLLTNSICNVVIAFY